MAWKRAGQQQCEAECIASRHAEQRLNERIDEQAAEPLDKANQQYIEKYKQPFSDRDLFPQSLRFSTTANALRLLGVQAGGGKVAASGEPLPVAEGADMTLQLHESAINNLAFDALAGRTIYEEKVQATAKDVLGHLPDKLKGDKDGKPWTITFAAREPVAVTFADDGFKITINGVRFYKGKDYCDATTIWASYKIKKTPEGFKAIRQGRVKSLRPARTRTPAACRRPSQPAARAFREDSRARVRREGHRVGRPLESRRQARADSSRVSRRLAGDRLESRPRHAEGPRRENRGSESPQSEGHGESDRRKDAAHSPRKPPQRKPPKRKR